MPRAVVEAGRSPVGRRSRQPDVDVPRSGAAGLAELAGRIRPQVLANEEHLPLSADLQEALDLRGLRRGSLIACSGALEGGATSLALALLSASSTAGSWTAVVGVPDLGLLAAAELGVALDRLVLVPDPSRRPAAALATLIEGCDLLVVEGRLQLRREEKVTLLARVRQRRIVLVVLDRARDRERIRRAMWPEVPDVAIEVVSSTVVGAVRGDGRITARRLELAIRQRRGGVVGRTGALWLPAAPTDPETGLVATRGDDVGGTPLAIALP